MPMTFDLAVVPPFKPMLAQATKGFPIDGGDLWFEPKWDGFRCIVFRDGDSVELGSRSQKSLVRYFPELVDPIRAQLPNKVVLDGEIVLPVNSMLDFDALGQRIHPAQSRIDRLSRELPARFVAFDLLAFDDNDVRDLPFEHRRMLLERLLAEVQAPLHLTPATKDVDLAKDWFHRFEGAGFDGVIAKPAGNPYVSDKRTLMKIKHQRTADVVVAGYRVHKDGLGVGSMLAGLYSDDGSLHHIGVVTGFTQKLRAELVEVLAPFRCELTGEGEFDHPWAQWGNATAHESGDQRLPGAVNRWNSSKDQSWVPIRPELVAEVTFENLSGRRLRHPARLVRWRPDKEIQDCRYDQLDQVAPPEFEEIFGSGDSVGGNVTEKPVAPSGY